MCPQCLEMVDIPMTRKEYRKYRRLSACEIGNLLVDDDGNVVGKPSPELNISSNADWVRGSGNTFYYKYAVSPTFSTGELLAQAIELQTDTDGTRQVIEVFADAIQSLPEKAVAQSWPVTVADEQIISAS